MVHTSSNGARILLDAEKTTGVESSHQHGSPIHVEYLARDEAGVLGA
jgi:hypothetical protein